MIDRNELTDAFEGAHQLMDDLERRLAAKTETPEAVRATLVKIIGALSAHGRRVPLSDKGPRGLGYGQPGNQEVGPDGKPLFRSDGQPLKYTTPDDAMIVASLPWFKDNWSAAIRAHFGSDLTKQVVDNHADRIKGHKKQIEDVEGVHPWETSQNWLGDLPPE